MRKNPSLSFFLLLTLLLLPFAQVSVYFFQIPVYIPELSLLLGVFSFFIYGRKRSREVKYPQKTYIIGSGLIILGSIGALLQGGVTSQELGAFKSWIFFPMLFAALLFQIGEDLTEKYRMLGAWFIGIASTAMVSLLPFFSFLTTYDGRLRFFYPSPNHLAMFVVPGILIGIFFCVQILFSGEKNRNREEYRMQAFILLPVVALMFVALLQTASLGGLISVLVGTTVLMLLLFVPPRIIRRLRLVILPAGALLFMVLAFGIDWGGLAGGQVQSSLGSRVMIWNASLFLIAEHPIGGIGMRNFQDAYLAVQPHFPFYREWAVPHPHNLFLAFWLFTGLMGLIGFLILCFGLFRDLLRRTLNSSMEDGCRSAYALFLSLFIAFLVFGFVDTAYFKNDLALFFWALVALSALPCDTKKAAKNRG